MRDITNKTVDELIDMQADILENEKFRTIHSFIDRNSLKKANIAKIKFLRIMYGDSIDFKNISWRFETQGVTKGNEDLILFDKTTNIVIKRISPMEMLNYKAVVNNELYEIAKRVNDKTFSDFNNSKECQEIEEFTVAVESEFHKKNLTEKLGEYIDQFYVAQIPIENTMTYTIDTIEETKELNDVLLSAVSAVSSDKTFDEWFKTLDLSVVKDSKISQRLHTFFNKVETFKMVKSTLFQEDLDVIHADFEKLKNKKVVTNGETNSIKVEGKENNEKIKKSGKDKISFFKKIKSIKPISKIIDFVKEKFTKEEEIEIEETIKNLNLNEINEELSNIENMINKTEVELNLKEIDDELLEINKMIAITEAKLNLEEIDKELTDINNHIEESSKELETANNVINENTNEVPVEQDEIHVVGAEDIKAEEMLVAEQKEIDNNDKLLLSQKQAERIKLLEEAEQARNSELEKIYSPLFDEMENIQQELEYEEQANIYNENISPVMKEEAEIKANFRKLRSELFAEYNAVDELDLPQAGQKKLATLKRKYSRSMNPLLSQKEVIVSNHETAENKYAEFLLKQEQKQYEIDQEKKAQEFVSNYLDDNESIKTR